jgi:hypothetical protein
LDVWTDVADCQQRIGLFHDFASDTSGKTNFGPCKRSFHATVFRTFSFVLDRIGLKQPRESGQSVKKSSGEGRIWISDLPELSLSLSPRGQLIPTNLFSQILVNFHFLFQKTAKF